MINVTVAWCTPSTVHVLDVRVAPGSTIAGVIRQSRILERCPDINLDVNPVGIFNRLCAPDSPVRDGDRIEIYRPLVADPKTARRRRAARPDPG